MGKIWSFSFYFLYFAAIAFFAPYMVLFYQSKGFSGAQIGLLTGIVPLVTLVSVPFWTGLADSTRHHRLIMSFVMLVGVATLILFPFPNSFGLILGLAILFNSFFSPVTAFADSATMHMLGPRRDLYGRVRLGGTFGFGLAATLAGVLVENFGLKIAFWGAALLFFFGFLVSLNLVHGSTDKKGTFNRERIQALLKNPHWVIFMVVAFTGGMAFAVSNTYFFPFMRELGAPAGIMGLALTVGTIAEIPVMLFINRLIVRFKSFGLLLFSAFMAGLRMLLFALATTPNFVLFAQILNAFAFPIMWVAGVSYAHEHAPDGMRTTAQGLFSAMVSGIGAAVGGFIGGLLLARIGGRGLYLVFALVVFAILLVVWFVRKKLPAEETPASAI